MDLDLGRRCGRHLVVSVLYPERAAKEMEGCTIGCLISILGVPGSKYHNLRGNHVACPIPLVILIMSKIIIFSCFFPFHDFNAHRILLFDAFRVAECQGELLRSLVEASPNTGAG